MSSIVLVTGGSGFIGSHVVDRLAATGHRPRILDTRPSPWHDARDVDTVIGDIRRLADVERAMTGCAAVCHLAAASDVGEVHASPAWATELNSTGTLNVLEAARRTGVDRVVYASTVWVYSDVDAEVVDEDTLLPHPAHLYTAGKLSGELYCRSYAELYGLRPTVVRFGIAYGPRARPAAVIPRFVDRALRGEPLTIAGTGEQERSFVYVEDLAEGVVCALVSRTAAGRTYNLAGRETTTIRGLAEIVQGEVADTSIVHTEGRGGDLRGVRVESSRAELELGWCAQTPLREGVRRYAAWLGEQADESPAAAPAAPAAFAALAAPAELPAAPARRRSLPALVTDGARNPAATGVVSLVAVASACAAVVVGAQDEAPAEDFTVLGLALLMPLWALTTVEWAPGRRRFQGAVTALLAAIAVLLLGVLSSTTGAAGLPHRSILAAVAVSVALTGALRLVPRRLTASHS